MASKIEFAVQMTCNKCVEAIRNRLGCVEGIYNVDVQLQNSTVIVETVLPTNDILQMLESTGRKAVVKGSAGSLAAVAVLEHGRADIHGVVRFMQIDSNTCIIDGTVDGLEPIPHNICVHETGDVSRGCESLGDLYIPETTIVGDVDQTKHVGIFGEITPEKNGRATFRFSNTTIDLSNIIGRSLVIAESNEDATEGKKLACGIIARSSDLFQNPKTICACDGVSIWDERNKPKSVL